MAAPNTNQLTRVFLKIKARREELKTAFKEEDSHLEAQQADIKSALLEHCKDEDINSVSTEAGRFTRSVKTNYWTGDWEEMYKFVHEHNCPEFFNKALNQTNVKTFLEAHPDIVPPGLNCDSSYVLSVYKPTKKRK